MSEKQRTLDQLRAANSYSKVMQLFRKVQSGELQEQKADDYAGYVVRLPADIRINGLGQALAQLQAAAKGKQDDPHHWVYRDLAEWLLKGHPQTPYKGEDDLLDALVNHDRREYLWALGEAMTWLEWHKKLCTAYLKKAEGNDR